MPQTLIIILLMAFLLLVVAWLIRSARKDREAHLPKPADPKRPFPHPAKSLEKCIQPANPSIEAMAQTISRFYLAWKKRFLIPEDEPGRSFVVCRTARGRLGYQMIATSEGQGFGMIITALMHPVDPQAKQDFDKLFNFCKAHPSLNNPALMSWQAQANNFLPSMLDSATDGDMDIAYALLLADRQWGSDGQINYKAEAIRIIKALEKECVHPTNHHLLLGNWVNGNKPKYYNGTRSSDFMPGHIRAFGAVSNTAFWNQVYKREREIMLAFSDQYSPETGLLPDFLVDVHKSPQPAPPEYLERNEDSHYGFNACRLPLRMGLGYLHTGDPNLLPILKRMTTWVSQKTNQDPKKIAAGYTLDGQPLADFDSMAFTAPLTAAAICCTENQSWLDALWDVLAAHAMDPDNYYASSLQLLSMLAVSKLWWNPINDFTEKTIGQNSSRLYPREKARTLI